MKTGTRVNDVDDEDVWRERSAVFKLDRRWSIQVGYNTTGLALARDSTHARPGRLGDPNAGPEPGMRL